MSESAILLKDALVAGVSQRYALELSQSQQNAACSPEHMQKMSDLLGYDVQAAAKARKRKLVIAALILAAVLVVGSLTAYANRDAIRDFFVRFVENNFVIEFPGNQPSPTITQTYDYSYIPEGYELKFKEIRLTGIYYQYTNENQKMLSLNQLLINAEIGFDGESGSSTMLDHNEIQILCVDYENIRYYIWNNGNYVFQICDGAKLPFEEIQKIIDGMLIIE